MRIVFWNIMHGGGYRATKIAEQIIEWKADIVALAEFRDTEPSRSIAQTLGSAGLVHQLSTVIADEPTWNALLLASRFELERVCPEAPPKPHYLWLQGKVNYERPFHIGVLLAPLGDQWYDFLDVIVKVAADRQLGPDVIIGDTNCALTGLDEDTAYSEDFKERFVAPLSEHGWRDMYRAFHPRADVPTWYSTYRYGFRLDHAYVNTALQPHVNSCAYDWGRAWDGKKLSDHAAILLDLNLPA